jgi:hypothetical protein
MEKVLVSFLFVLFLSSNPVKAEIIDTIKITPQYINTNVLREGTHRYLVYAKMKHDSVRTLTQFWTRDIKRTQYHGREVIEINQSWEDKDSIMHIVKSISDAKTMQPIYHNTWWKVQNFQNSPKMISTTSVDFISKIVEENGRQIIESDTSKRYKAIWSAFKSIQGQYHLNWHLDLETFPLLPFKDGIVFEIPFYEPGSSFSLTKVFYKVNGSAILEGYNNQKIDCWLLVHESTGNKETFWISKKTKEVLKLEQVFRDSFYRFKIKLGFSN